MFFRTLIISLFIPNALFVERKDLHKSTQIKKAHKSVTQNKYVHLQNQTFALFTEILPLCIEA